MKVRHLGSINCTEVPDICGVAQCMYIFVLEQNCDICTDI